jgi:hypothetical protein
VHAQFEHSHAEFVAALPAEAATIWPPGWAAEREPSS